MKRRCSITCRAGRSAGAPLQLVLDHRESVKVGGCEGGNACESATAGCERIKRRVLLRVSMKRWWTDSRLKELGLRNVKRRVQWNEAAGMLKRYAGRVAKIEGQDNALALVVLGEVLEGLYSSYLTIGRV